MAILRAGEPSQEAPSEGLLAVILLALAGILAIMSFTVAQRSREIGVRAVLGARPADIVVTIGRRAALQLGIGALAGMPLAGWLFFLTQEDPQATGSAMVAAVVPSPRRIAHARLARVRRSARASLAGPTEAMRAE